MTCVYNDAPPNLVDAFEFGVLFPSRAFECGLVFLLSPHRFSKRWERMQMSLRETTLDKHMEMHCGLGHILVVHLKK